MYHIMNLITNSYAATFSIYVILLRHYFNGYFELNKGHMINNRSLGVYSTSSRQYE